MSTNVSKQSKNANSGHADRHYQPNTLNLYRFHFRSHELLPGAHQPQESIKSRHRTRAGRRRCRQRSDVTQRLTTVTLLLTSVYLFAPNHRIDTLH